MKQRSSQFTSNFFIALGIVALSLVIGNEDIVRADQPKEILGKDTAPMVLVPEGVFPMGVPAAARDGGVDERPNHDVFLDTFYIDKYEVTNGRYLTFITETGHRTPQHPSDPTKGLWQGNTMPESVVDLPVINVDWFDAEAYCRWAEKRLPTEAEWEKAAKGPNDWRFPWGDLEPTDKHLNYNQVTWRGETTLVPVGIYEAGKSPYGAYDMAGNVWEWCFDYYKRGYPGGAVTDPTGHTSPGKRISRGGGWNNKSVHLRAANRATDYAPERSNNLGVRLVRSGS